MIVKLRHSTPLHICSDAIRKCWDSGENSDSTEYKYQVYDWNDLDEPAVSPYTEPMIEVETGLKDKALIERIGNKFKHGSTLEHLVYNFEIIGVSRALLQELARHRMASLSVKSTRYTLAELKEEEQFHGSKAKGFDYKRANKYIVLTGDLEIDEMSIRALENVRYMVSKNKPNDKVKYCLPESYKTELAWTINARSLQNFLYLRTSKSALWEIRILAKAIFEALPEEHQYLFKDNLDESIK